MDNDRTVSWLLACWFENVLEGQVIYLEIMGLAHKACLGVLVRKWLGGAGNMMRNDVTVSQGLAWCVGSKMAWSVS